MGFRSVTVVADPTVTDLAALGESLAWTPVADLDRPAAHRVEIPVAFDGSDLDDVAHVARISPSRIVELLTGTDLRVAFVGFAPGFAYLIGLPPDLASVPRRPTPAPGGAGRIGGSRRRLCRRLPPGIARRVARGRPHGHASVRSREAALLTY